MNGWRECLRRIQVGMLLVVEEDVRTQRLQNAPFVHAAQEMRLIDGDVPGTERVDDAFVRGCASGGDDGGLEKTAIVAVALFALVFQYAQIAKFAEQIP